MATIQPISKSLYAGKFWKKPTDYLFAAKDTLAALSGHEMPVAAMSLPLAFTLDQEQKMMPVLVQGFLPGKNLLVDSSGKWQATYVPAVYRSYPFSLGHTEDGQELLCIDEASGLVNDAEGELFFSENGEPEEILKKLFNQLHQIHQNRLATRVTCETLQSVGIFKPWPIKVKINAGEKTVEGLYQIDEAVLNQLDDEAFSQIRKAGGLPLIYCQLLSMQNLPRLGEFAQNAAPAPVPDIEKILGLEDDIFKFS